MPKKRREQPVYTNVEITDAGAEGKAVARVNDQVVFIPFAAPGDVVDIQVTKKRRSYLKGKILEIHTYSDKRTEPRCEHFGTCGGCKWQHLKYEEQLRFKQKQVKDNLSRIGKFEMPELHPILPSENIYFYRNKLEFTFSGRRWLTEYSKEIDFADRNMNGLGFYMPGMFDRVLDINNCYLQEEPSNSIRLAVKDYTQQLGLEYYDVKNHTGFLRNLLIRSSTTGDLMVVLVVKYEDHGKINEVLQFIADKFPQITSLMYAVNTGVNDVFANFEIKLFKGNPYIEEEMEGLRFRIGPVSFYQTNSHQAYQLYKVARDYAGLTGNEVVYDLYTGTGTIANFVASRSKKVVGIEYVESAVEDARVNSELNGLDNTSYFAGDIARVLDEDFVNDNGKPDVVITDPPRAGMHQTVVEQLLKIAPERIVYISCNPATQARDVTLLDEMYAVEEIQPVDMFPHTHHVENVIKLVKRK
ncbi:MAG: 23S rRNA (uracil(1939)-C(5))-methyltransferase RlmD [Bacteroidales bacterium]|nr:23S rRNA (uracil(1939)-C(5))-methyltransferase RlmD [Bacteroidales bacterium]